MAAMSFLESVELADGFTGTEGAASSGSSRSASIHSPRISFSNEFAQLSEDQGKKQQQIPSIHNPSSSGEFEFTMNPSAAAQAPVRSPPMLSADELFYKGKLLPLHLPPRIRMVQDLSEVLSRDRDPGKNPTTGEAGVIGKSPPLGVMRRERSLRSPARPSVIASTLKSSSYPGYSSRPSSPPKSSKCASGSSNSRWRDLFGLKKSISSPKAGASSSSSSSSSSVPTKILKMIFHRGSSSSSSSTSSSGMNPNSPLCPELPDQHPELPSSNEALLPLLRDSSSLSDQPEMTHSSSVSSSASSNWTASSASSSNASSSSFSVEFPENLEQLGKKPESKLGNSRARGPIGSTPTRTRRSGAHQGGRYQKSSPTPTASQSGKTTSGNLQRSGSINRRSSAGAGGVGAGSGSGVSSGTTRMQLQDHVLIGHGNNKLRSENSWRRSGDLKSMGSSGGSSGASNPSNYSSSVRVTPVLHVPACIGPSLRSVRVHGLKRLFSSSSSGSNAPGKPQAVV